MKCRRGSKRMKVIILYANSLLEMGGTYDYFDERDRW